MANDNPFLALQTRLAALLRAHAFFAALDESLLLTENIGDLDCGNRVGGRNIFIPGEGLRKEQFKIIELLFEFRELPDDFFDRHPHNIRAGRQRGFHLRR